MPHNAQESPDRAMDPLLTQLEKTAAELEAAALEICRAALNTSPAWSKLLAVDECLNLYRGVIHGGVKAENNTRVSAFLHRLRREPRAGSALYMAGYSENASMAGAAVSALSPSNKPEDPAEAPPWRRPEQPTLPIIAPPQVRKLKPRDHKLHEFAFRVLSKREGTRISATELGRRYTLMLGDIGAPKYKSVRSAACAFRRVLRSMPKIYGEVTSQGQQKFYLKRT